MGAAAGSSASTSSALPVSVSADRESTKPGDTIGVVVRNDGNTSIFLPGCNAYLLERREGERFAVTREKQCFWEGIAVEVKPKSTLRLEEPTEGLAPGSYRIRIDYHIGCRPGEPLSRAGGKPGERVVSAAFSVR